MRRAVGIALSILLAYAAGSMPAEALKEPEPTVYQPRRACETEFTILKRVGERHPKLRDAIKSCNGAENVEECLVVKIRARDEARKKQLTNLILLGALRERLPELRNILALQFAIAASSNDEENAPNLKKIVDMSDETIKSFDEAMTYINQKLNDE